MFLRVTFGLLGFWCGIAVSMVGMVYAYDYTTPEQEYSLFQREKCDVSSGEEKWIFAIYDNLSDLATEKGYESTINPTCDNEVSGNKIS